MPFAKNVRIHARSFGLHRDGWVILRYRRVHCRNNIACIAQVRLINRLKTQSELTQTAYRGGEKAGGLAKAEGVDGRDRLGSARV